MDILKLSSREVRLLGKLCEIAEEAHEASILIQQKFQTKFGIGKREILVFSVNQFDEYYGNGYLSVDGIFRYEDNWWGGREWSTGIDEQSIFELYRAELLKQLDDLGEVDYRMFTDSEEEISMACLAPHFREFVASLSKQGKEQ